VIEESQPVQQLLAQGKGKRDNGSRVDARREAEWTEERSRVDGVKGEELASDGGGGSEAESPSSQRASPYNGCWLRRALKEYRDKQEG